MPEPAETPPTARQWLGLVAVALGVALIVVDMTIVNVILAPIIEDLSIGSSEAQWIQESYAITFAALLLVTGRLSDLYGARRIFLLGLAVFGVTSLLAASAPSGGLLILARFVQGVGGAMMLPTSLALLNATFTGRARGQAFAVWGSTIGAAAAVGPLLGGGSPTSPGGGPSASTSRWSPSSWRGCSCTWTPRPAPRAVSTESARCCRRRAWGFSRSS